MGDEVSRGVVFLHQFLEHVPVLIHAMCCGRLPELSVEQSRRWINSARKDGGGISIWGILFTEKRVAGRIV